MTSVDFAPLLNTVIIPLLAPILASALLWLVYKVQSALHVHVLDSQRPLVESAIQNAIALATTRLNVTQLNINMPSHVAAVVGYVNATVPDALTKLGISPAQLGEKVAAEIAKATL